MLETHNELTIQWRKFMKLVIAPPHQWRTVNYGIETIKFRAPYLWGKLPSKYKPAASLDELKVKCKKWKYDMCLQIPAKNFKKFWVFKLGLWFKNMWISFVFINFFQKSGNLILLLPPKRKLFRVFNMSLSVSQRTSGLF